MVICGANGARQSRKKKPVGKWSMWFDLRTYGDFPKSLLLAYWRVTLGNWIFGNQQLEQVESHHSNQHLELWRGESTRLGIFSRIQEVGWNRDYLSGDLPGNVRCQGNNLATSRLQKRGVFVGQLLQLQKRFISDLKPIYRPEVFVVISSWWKQWQKSVVPQRCE